MDNMAVVQVIQATYCKDSHLMHLIRLLVFFVAYFNFWFSASDIAGKSNTRADALSRSKHAVFLAQVSEAVREPVKVPSQLINLLSQNITWMCTAWMEQFSTILQLL